ncbi:MAG: PH domain-containing protein [Mucinivorans sp.]
MSTKKRVFRSRISVLLLGFILAIFIPISLPMFQRVSIVEICIIGGLMLFILFVFTGIHYIFSGNKLLIKMWFIPMGSINILEISSLKRSYNPLSSPAASLKRLAVYRYGNLYALLSPVKEQEFIEELKAINPRIKLNVYSKAGLWRIWDWDI